MAVVGTIQVYVPAPLHDVPLQHGLPSQNPPEAEPVQIQRFKLSIQDQFCYSTTHSGGLLQSVAAEASGEVHVADQRVHADDAVLV